MRIAIHIALAAIFAIVPLLFPWLGFVFTVVLAKGLAALGVAILLRAGLISIGHAAFYALGAYVVATLSGSAVTDLVLQLVATVLVCGLAGALIGLFMVRYRGIFFAMLNLAVSMVFFTLLSKLYKFTGGTDGMRVDTPTLFGAQLERTTLEPLLLYGGLALVVVVCLLVHRYLKSPMGEALSAVETNEIRLEYLGVSVPRVLLSAYTLSAALAGLGGGMHALLVGHVVPELAYWTTSGQLVLVAVLGGIGGVVGPFIGSFFLEMVRSFAVIYVADTWNLIVGAGLLIVIFFLPVGLYGLLDRLATRRSAK